MPVAGWVLGALMLGALGGCQAGGSAGDPTRAPSVQPSTEEAAELEVRALLDELYAAFCFDAGGQPDWGTQRRSYLEGAVFVAPLRAGHAPVGANTEQFLSDFSSFASSGKHATTGLHERILEARITVFGRLAQAFVLFEGYAPGAGDVQSRGLDSLQLVRTDSGWRVVSFTTEYESEDTTLPAQLGESALPTR